MGTIPSGHYHHHHHHDPPEGKAALQRLLALPHGDGPVLTASDMSARVYWHDIENVIREWDSGQWRQMLMAPQVPVVVAFLRSVGVEVPP